MLSTMETITNSATMAQTFLIFFPRKSIAKGYQLPPLPSLVLGDEIEEISKCV